jgi:hypothetical protein
MSTLESTVAEDASPVDPPQAERTSAAAATTDAENLCFRTLVI